jgi:5-methylthioadenosine/S-adenosylhomocysteine deaminase
MDKDRRILSGAGVLYEQGRIAAVGDSADIRAIALERGVPIKDAKGAVLFSGLIQYAYAHIPAPAQGIGRGYGAGGLVARCNRTGGFADPRAAHLRGCVRLRAGVATQRRYNACRLYAGAPGVRPVGCGNTNRSQYGYAACVWPRLSQRGQRVSFPKALIEDLENVLQETLSLKRSYEDERVKIWLAPAAAWAVSLDGLKRTVDFSIAEDIPIMMHVFETDTDDNICLSRYQKRAIEYYEEAGLLRPGFLAVHCVKTDDEVVARFAQNGVCVSHNPVSNLYLASGIAPVPDFLKNGVAVGLATDGAASNNSNNMLEVMKLTALIHKAARNDPLAMTAWQALEMATVGAAKCIGLSQELGSIEPGKRADFFLFDPAKSPGCCPMHDPVATLVYSSDTRGIVTVVVDGETLLENGEFTRLDEEELLRSEQRLARELYSLAGF